MAGDTALSWKELQQLAFKTETGTRLQEEEAAREAGAGPAHTDAKLRLFGRSEEDVRVTLFRDMAAWCPYCQKVWLLLEEKQIPYRIKKINMRSYGPKPEWFLRKVPGGLLPAIELDGNFITDSLPIMQLLDATFPSGPTMVPPPGTDERSRAEDLLRLERELFAAWCTLTFQPGKGLFDGHEKQFFSTLDKVDKALEERPGPWFLGGETPSLVDLQYVSHVERMLASVAYWKGLRIRGEARFRNIDAWLSAFEERPAYIATKSDYYTHVCDIPPQYGPGYTIDQAKTFASQIAGEGDAWRLPLHLGPSQLEPLAPLQDRGDESARHEAACTLISNAENVIRFAARGAGDPGQPQYQAPLADPNAVPNQALLEPIDVCLRHVATSLISGVEAAEPAADADVQGKDEALASCLIYLRDRVGVPRDMGQAAAMHFRAHLNWMVDKIA